MATAACAGALALGACGGEDDGPPPRPPDQPPGLGATNEQEVEALLRETRNVRARCSGGRPMQPLGKSRFECHGGGQEFVVDWQHYGNGRYEIRADGRVVARGVLTIAE